MKGLPQVFVVENRHGPPAKSGIAAPRLKRSGESQISFDKQVSKMQLECAQ
jgi:hypothetical protein